MLNTAFITPVLCPTNSNRHFPFLSNIVSHWPRQEATLPCFSDIISLSTTGTLWFLLYFWPFIFLMVHLMKPSSQVCERGWKVPRRTSDTSPQHGMVPSRDAPLSVGLLLNCFPNQENGSYDPLVLFVLVPFELTTHISCSLARVHDWGQSLLCRLFHSRHLHWAVEIDQGWPPFFLLQWDYPGMNFRKHVWDSWVGWAAS